METQPHVAAAGLGLLLELLQDLLHVTQGGICLPGLRSAIGVIMEKSRGCSEAALAGLPWCWLSPAMALVPEQCLHFP